MHSMIQLFLIMALGYLLYKVKITDADINRKLTRIILDVTCPALILSSVIEQSGDRDMGNVVVAMIYTAAFFIVVPLFAILLVKIMRIPKEQQGLYMFMTTYSNVGFMGFPVTNALFGPEGVFYAAIFNIGFNLATFTIGVIQINYGIKGDDDKERLIDLKKLLSPGVVFSILALVIYLLNIPVTEDIAVVCDMVGGITSPLAMILVGGTLASIEIRSVFTEYRIYPFMVIKQILLPLGVCFLMGLFVKEPMLRNAFTVLALMPVANNSVMFSILYGNNEQIAARNVFITTLAAIITVPFMLSVLL